MVVAWRCESSARVKKGRDTWRMVGVFFSNFWGFEASAAAGFGAGTGSWDEGIFFCMGVAEM